MLQNRGLSVTGSFKLRWNATKCYEITRGVMKAISNATKLHKNVVKLEDEMLTNAIKLTSIEFRIMLLDNQKAEKVYGLA